MAKRKGNRRKGNRKKSGVPRSLALGPTYPNGLLAKHKYSDSVMLEGNYVQNDVQTNAMYSFRTSSLYDPDRTGGGHQPLFYDEMCAIYNQYRVLGAKAKVRFVNCCNEPVIVFGAHLGAPLGSGWEPDALMERKDIKSKFLSGRSGGKNICTMNLFYSPSKFYAQSKSNLKADNALVGTGDGDTVPSKASYFELGMAQVDSSNSGGAEFDTSANHRVKMYIEIEYLAFWNDRILKTGSS
jgi:hypothetical protein